MSLSSQSSGSGSRPTSPEDESGKSVVKGEIEEKLPLDIPDGCTDQSTPPTPEYIKRPRNAFMTFLVEEREKLLRKHPQMPMKTVSRTLAEMWKNLDDEGKRPYFEKSKEIKVNVKKVMRENPNMSYRPAKRIKTVPVTHSPNAGGIDSFSLPPSVSSFSGRSIPLMPRQFGSFLSAPKSTANTVKVSKPSSAISASIAEALGMSFAPATATVSTSNAQSVNSGHVMPPPLRSSTSVNRVVSRPPSVSTPQTASSIQSIPSSSSTTMQANQPYIRPGLSTPQQALDMFYLALCEPAFPQPNEAPLTPYPANFCYDAYMRMTNGQSLL